MGLMAAIWLQDVLLGIDTGRNIIIQADDPLFQRVTDRQVRFSSPAFVNDILGTLRERGLDLKAGCVVFIGGGALLLRKYLEQSGKIGRCIFL